MPKRESVAYTFEVQGDLHRKGITKAHNEGIPIAPFMRIAWEQFLGRSAEANKRLLKQHGLTPSGQKIRRD